MPIWIINYDLRAPGRNYEALYRALRSVPFAHPLESFWLVEAEGPATRIRDILKGHMDKNDGLTVIEFTEPADWATFNINKPSSDWIRSVRP